jgi:hypothetical protein
MTAQVEPLCPILKDTRQKRQQATKKGVPMNTRHNYFPLEITETWLRYLLLFLLFLGCFFLGCHELNALLKKI